ncbi:MAG: beta-ketoacyl-[acyl-carrier-protein] synthase family protein [Candidatus Omnitrophica bacterium]|nr:beta-ketoacyl-[acyl-carrier-protein] synthase family protein [Candidatus Omnitrophota bacterium]
MKSNRRIVVTGIGIVSSVGIGREEFWRSVISGKSGISEVTSLDTSILKCHNGGEVKNFNPKSFIPKRKVKFLGKASQLAIAASTLALEDARLAAADMPKKKTGVLVGTTTGEKPLEELIEVWAKGGLKELDRQKIMQASVNNISANVALQFKAQGENFLFPTACAAGNYAVGYGSDLIRSGALDYALAGGSDAFSHVAFAGFQRIYAMAPEKCQPFDKNRKGMILGEGSGIVLLENLDSALKRGADIYAEVLGYGLSCDAYHATAPEPQSIARAMEKALKESGIGYKDVDYISAHGTGTPLNDKVECQAIKQVLKERYKEVMVSSIKSMLGHPMGAASAIESAACCLAIKEGIVPPTINFETPDPECDIDCVPNKARKAAVRVALNNGFAFGGNNATVVFKKYEG